jgi:phage-related protein
MSLLNGINSMVGKVISAILNMGNDIIRNVTGIDLMGAGRAIIDGFVGGLTASWEAGKKFIGGIGDWIKEHKGPISYDKKLLIPAGKAIMDGLDGGLRQQFKNVQSTVLGMGDALSDSLQMNLAVDSTQSILSGQLVDDLNRFKLNASNSNNQATDILNIVDKLTNRPILVSNQMDKKEMSRTLAVPITDEQTKRNQLLDAIYGRG